MLGRLPHGLAMVIAMPTLALASCHLVGGTNDLEIDPNFGVQGTGAGPTTTGGGDGGATTVTTTSAGGSGGTVVLCDAASCDGQDQTCQWRACINNQCGFEDADLLTPCAYDMGNYCDGFGSCVECIDNSHCTGGPCQDNLCRDASCADMMTNGNETDEDCGGIDCGPCPPGDMCGQNSDCTTNICAGTCLSCVTTGCGSSEYCDGRTGRCEGKKFTGSCDDHSWCVSGCCFLGGCNIPSFCD